MDSEPKPNLLDLSREQLADLLKAWGQPAFRAKQIHRHLHLNLAARFDEMTDLPKALRERLNAETTIGSLQQAVVHAGDAGMTRKALFKLRDGSPVETVLMVYPDRATVCVSSQSGCPMACVFCATGKLGFLHDLTRGEIVEQVYWAARQLREPQFENRRLTNVVFMGMGEPFNNYTNWRAAVEILHDPEGFNLGARSYTVSTVGLVPGIRKLAEDPLPINLAISLHAPDDETRTAMMPVNKRFPIADLLEAVRDYTEKTNRRVSFEYVLLQEKNDFPEQADCLGQLLRASGIRPAVMHVNLIPWNPVPGTPLGRSHRKRVLAFQEGLLKHAVPCTVRVERGIDIGAACGQLAGTA
ncbi:MAG: 23S rRNA (adenine(2503)-C(2))-methyltransferase RlmN [Verrucomicrobia bacterium]|nr:23S rRNA (adenine(2503)-C(2))-methyltransferase RlmN [Verrucomicrobiota bacterium]